MPPISMTSSPPPPAAAAPAPDLPLPRKRRAGWWQWLVLLAAALLVSLPALNGGFLWDDELLITGNRFIRSPDLALEAFRHPLFAENLASSHYRPVQTLSLIADYWLWGKNPFGFHLTNVLAHGLGAGLLFWLLRRLLTLGRLCPPAWVDRLAFAVALLWVVHPAHSAAVAYIAGRADPMAFGFAALGWLCFLNVSRPEASGPARLTAALGGGLCFFCALGSRESAACWMALLGLTLPIFTPRATRASSRALILGAILAALGGYLLLRLSLPPPDRANLPPAASFPPLGRVLLLLQALGAYGCILLWPGNLHMDRTLGIENALLDRGAGDPWLWIAPGTLVGLLALAALAAGCLKAGPGRALRRFGTLWLLCGFLPVSNLVSLNATLAEHWLYLPSVGLLLAAAGWLLELPAWPPQFRRLRLAPALVLLAVALALGARTFARSGDWVGERDFYAKTIVDGGGSPRMRYNYATCCLQEGDRAASLRALDELLRRAPRYTPALVLRGRLLMPPPAAQTPAQRAESFAALRQELRARGLKTAHDHRDDLNLTVKLAETLLLAGHPDQALATVEESRNAAGAGGPAAWPLVRLRAGLTEKAGRPQEAADQVSAFAQACWWHRESQLALADLQTKLGDEPAALRTLAAADRLDVRDAAALQRTVAIQVRRGDFSRALDSQRAAVRKEPRQPDHRRLLGEMFSHLGRAEEAREQEEIAARLEVLRTPSPKLPASDVAVN